MPVFLILLAGLAVGIGGIVYARLPAFLALTLGAILVAWLTPQQNLFDAFISQSAVQVDSVSENEIQLTSGPFIDGQDLMVRPRIQPVDQSPELSSVAVVTVNDRGQILVRPDVASQVLPGDAVVTPREAQSCLMRSRQPPLMRVTTSMGEYFGKLAIIIVCASIIGRCLLDSGSAERIVRTLLQLLGQRLAPAALTVSSFVLGIPVFFDTVFYLMIPIAKVLRIQTGAGYLLYVLAIVAGATMAHSLVPPTPGPLAVAEMFQVDLAQMIVGGGLVGIVAATAGLLWASMMNRFFTLEIPDEDTDSLESTAQKDTAELPPFYIAVLPIALPLLLISMKPVLSSSHPLITTLSDKNVALLLSAAIALGVYLFTIRPSKETMSAAMQSAIASAGAILLITCAGGAFGRILFQTNVASLLTNLPGTSPVVLVTAAFLVTAGIRTAQGSATVAMMTAGGVFGPLVTSGTVDVAPLYMALAIGCGSKPVSWMNDSGFWIVTRMSGMSETDGLKFVSPLLTVMGVAGLLAVIAGVVFIPVG